MLLVKGGLGFLALVLGGVALMNYRILLHHDGQVEFARKTEWTLADSFRFIPEEVPAPPPPPPAPVAASVAPPPPAPAPVVASAPPSPVAPVRSARPPAPVVAARVKPVKPVVVARVDEDEAGEDPIRAVLSTVRPVEPVNPEVSDCRKIRGKLKSAVTRMDAKYPASKARELRVFDLIQEGYLDSLQSCPSMGGYILQRRAQTPEIKCTVHGAL